MVLNQTNKTSKKGNGKKQEAAAVVKEELLSNLITGAYLWWSDVGRTWTYEHGKIPCWNKRVELKLRWTITYVKLLGYLEARRPQIHAQEPIWTQR